MSLFGDIGSALFAPDVAPQYQVNQDAYQLQDKYRNQGLLMQALQQAQSNQAPQAAGSYAAMMPSNVNLGAAQQAVYQTGPTSIDPSQANQAYAQQQQLANMQLATAAGQGPSVAQQQMTLGNQQNLQALMSAAGSLRGGANPALQQRQLMDNLATANQQNNANTALARAQESLNAQQAAGSTLGTSRDQSLNQATTNANLGQQAAQNFNQANQYNTGATNQFALQQGQMNLQNAQNNAAMQNQASQAALQQSLANAQLRQQQQQQNLSGQLGAIQGLTGLSAQATEASQAAQQAQQNAYQSWAGGYNSAQSAGAAVVPNLVGQGISAGASALFSDERLKTDIDRDAVRPDMQAFLDAVDPASYRYKADKHGVGRKWGVMAQSLQKSEAGRSLVKDTGEGLTIDTTTGFGTLLAALKDVHERTKRLEGEGK